MARGKQRSRAAAGTARTGGGRLPTLQRARTAGQFKEMLNYRVVTNPRDLRTLVERYSQADQIALDIETASNRGFGVKNGAVRLIQVGIDDPHLGTEQSVVDCFSVDPMPLVTMLSDPDRQKIIHYAAFEKEWFRFHHGVWLHNVYDTCTAWQVIHAHRASVDENYGKRSSTLKAVTENVLGAPMSKEEQASQWGAKTLTDSQIEYAALDVAILKPIQVATDREIHALGLEEQLATKNRATDGRVHGSVKRKAQEADDSQILWRVLDGARTLSELERAWKASRQVAVHHGRRSQLWEFYLRRREEFSPARAAA